jgi:urocanate hydratase
MIKAPRGTNLSCKGWHQEAALRCLMNNLDSEVAERPEELIVYGGAGKAARNWTSYHAIVRELQNLESDETLLIQSGKPVGVFRTHSFAPRVLIANSNLVGAWANWTYFNELERQGLMMYGQMTAGSWIYIGTQGIVQGTFETFAAVADRHFGGDLSGRVVVSGGMGGMGGAQPLAATMNGAVFIGIDVDRNRIQRRVETGYCDLLVEDLDEALDLADKARKEKRAVSIGLVGNCAEVLPLMIERNFQIDVLTDQTSAHDPLFYIPENLSMDEAQSLRSTDPESFVKRSMESMRRHVEAMLEFKKRGAVTFDYGNNIRKQAFDAGCRDAFTLFAGSPFQETRRI